jgi:CoA-transferase family III
MSILSPISTVGVLCRQHALRLGVASFRRTNVTHARPEPEMGKGISPPLKGIKIVDLTRVLAAPTATMLLADLGYVCSTTLPTEIDSRVSHSADVIKIEEVGCGDDTSRRNCLLFAIKPRANIQMHRVMAATLCPHHCRRTSGSISSSSRVCLFPVYQPQQTLLHSKFQAPRGSRDRARAHQGCRCARGEFCDGEACQDGLRLGRL